MWGFLIPDKYVFESVRLCFWHFPKLYSWKVEGKVDRIFQGSPVEERAYRGNLLEMTSLWFVPLKLNIQKTKTMASGPITSWQIQGETVETVSDFIFLGSKITADGDCSHEIKRHLLLGRKVMTNLDSIFKSRDITLPTKVHLVKALVFPVVMYGRES